MDESVGHVVHDKYFLLRKAENIVVEGRALVDLTGRQLHVGSLVHDDRRVSGAGSDGLLSGAQKRVHHAHAAGSGHQTDPGAGRQLVHVLHGGLFRHRDEVRGASRVHNGLI